MYMYKNILWYIRIYNSTLNPKFIQSLSKEMHNYIFEGDMEIKREEWYENENFTSVWWPKERLFTGILQYTVQKASWPGVLSKTMSGHELLSSRSGVWRLKVVWKWKLSDHSPDHARWVHDMVLYKTPEQEAFWTVNSFIGITGINIESNGRLWTNKWPCILVPPSPYLDT